MIKRALITGITGQDGSYLAEFLLAKGYKVFGLTRQSKLINFERLAHFQDKIELLQGDLSDQDALVRALKQSEATEVYNLASQSVVTTSWTQPVLAGEFTALGVTRMLESIRIVNPAIRFYQASSSEMFGIAKESPQNESTPFHPRSPYGVAKLYGHWITVNYRETYNLFACSGILFNHESPRRSLEFVTRKVTHTAAQIKLGLKAQLKMGNLDAQRDWGFAGDYVAAMWQMLQQEKPEDFVVATSITHSVRNLLETAFGYLDLDYRNYVETDPTLVRPTEKLTLRGNYLKAERQLGWRPSVSFENLIRMMVDEDIARLKCATTASSLPAGSL